MGDGRGGRGGGAAARSRAQYVQTSSKPRLLPTHKSSVWCVFDSQDPFTVIWLKAQPSWCFHNFRGHSGKWNTNVTPPSPVIAVSSFIMWMKLGSVIKTASCRISPRLKIFPLQSHDPLRSSVKTTKPRAVKYAGICTRL